MTAILERRESESLWGSFCNWITNTKNRVTRAKSSFRSCLARFLASPTLASHPKKTTQWQNTFVHPKGREEI